MDNENQKKRKREDIDEKQIPMKKRKKDYKNDYAYIEEYCMLI